MSTVTTKPKKVYTVTITEDDADGGFVGRCEELHANSEGETYGEIMENMREVMKLAAKDFDGIDDFSILVE